MHPVVEDEEHDEDRQHGGQTVKRPGFHGGLGRNRIEPAPYQPDKAHRAAEQNCRGDKVLMGFCIWSAVDARRELDQPHH